MRSLLAACVLAVVSGLLLAGAFPPLEWGVAAWVAFAPLLFAVRGAPRRRAAGLGFLAGCAFWLPSLHWLTHVTVGGWFGLALYCALYTIPFAVFAAAWTGRFGTGRTWPNLGLMLGAAAVWAGGEFLRATLFTGFPWNPVAVSQYRRLALIQHAEWGGVYVVSALVVFVNAAIFAVAADYASRRRAAAAPRRIHVEFVAAAALVLAAVLSGARLMNAAPVPDRQVRFALLQPAIPQYEKWSDAFVASMYGRLRDLTEASLRAARPDLVVWPETAVPDDLRASEPAHALLLPLSTNGVPLLVGALDAERSEGGEVRLFNTSFLVGPGVAILQKYDKQHLVIFGEYVPLQRYFPWLRKFTPIPCDVVPGREPTVFRLDAVGLKFSVVICFEDTVAALSRDFVRRGARLLLTQTNDAWFDVSSGSRQHMLHCIFRCIENRVPAARCANSGVTCWIDACGRIGGPGGEKGGSLPTTLSDGSVAGGFLTAVVPFRAAGAAPTFFTRHGDVCGGSMAGIGMLLFTLAWWGGPRRGQSVPPPADAGGEPPPEPSSAE